MKCPDCDEDVCVGTAGPAGIVQHQGKKPCKKVQQAKEAKRKIRTLFQVGVTRIKAPLPVTASTSSDDWPRQGQQTETERKGCKLGWKLIAELKAAAEGMGIDVPIATEGDDISGFGRARATSECASVPNDEVWEVVKPGLDRLLGSGRSVVEVESIVRRGAMGVEGFCQYLTHLVEEKGV